jgi:O-antigen/teichoic acid export membrane protein
MKRSGRPASLFPAAAATYGANLAVAVLSLVNVLIVARALGPSGRGDVAFLIAVGLLTSHLASMSVHEANANLAGSEPAVRSRLGTNSVLFALALGAAAMLVVVTVVALFPAVGGEVDRALLWVALTVVPVFVLKNYLSFLVRADYGFAVANIAWVVGPVCGVAVNGLLALTGVITVGLAIVVWVGGQVAGTVILACYVARHVGFGPPDLALARRTLRFGLRAHLGRLMEVGNYRVDQWFLGAIAGSRELGLYSIAVAWAEVLFYLPGVLGLVQRPDLVRANAREAARLAAKVCRVALLLAVAAALALVVAAPLLCVTVFGEPFAGSVDDLRVLALGAFGIALLELLKNALLAQRRALAASAAVAVAFSLTVVLDLILIPSYGGLGAAIATAAAYTGGGVAVALIFTRALGGRLGELVPGPGDVVWLMRRLRALAAMRAPVREVVR